MDAFSQLVVTVALFGGIPLVLALFTFLEARRAVVVSSIAAWLLPPPIGIDLPGIPNYDKAAAATGSECPYPRHWSRWQCAEPASRHERCYTTADLWS
jgi:hypothetical protein